jgi:hypothetical protein
MPQHHHNIIRYKHHIYCNKIIIIIVVIIIIIIISITPALRVKMPLPLDALELIILFVGTYMFLEKELCLLNIKLLH